MIGIYVCDVIQYFDHIPGPDDDEPPAFCDRNTGDT